ncbi:MAG: UDP-glucose 4-epimerase GalE [Candidatus Shapirobacteria bacterium]|nr:UDP-glucose 4-epimerase GalE [Candidatus Shapirobacteria bacterium]
MILVVGGAGYIGSHINKELNKEGYKTVIFDSLVKGHKEAVKWGEFFEGDLSDIEQIREVFKKYPIEAVMHFAAFIEVGESVKDPQKYYQNNLENTLNLFQVMLENNVKKIIFSSTAATFGNPEYIPIDEKHPQNPINPYGQAKLMVEKILSDYDNAYELKSVALRYFNACGADLDGEIGENHSPESHLIPLILDAAIGKREDIKIFGTDYPTPDGTCVRDYIHVIDLAQAHVLALKYLMDKNQSDRFNLGNGNGFSVREVIDMAKKVTGIDFKVTEADRRPGDPPELVADSKKAKEVLRWSPKYADLQVIIDSAWKWHQKSNAKS